MSSNGAPLGDAETKTSLEKIKRQLASSSGRNLLQGPLLKRSETLRKWNERWVILDPTTGKMEYKVRRNEPTVKGTMVFDANSTITISPVNFQELPKYDGCCFYIGTPQRKDYFLCAETPAAARAWVSTLHATQLVLKAHKEAVNTLSGNGSTKLGTVATVVAAANSTALEASKEIEAAMQISMKNALGAMLHKTPDLPMDDLSIMKETLRVKDEELQNLARDLRARDSTIKEIAEKLSETAEAAASAAHTMDEQRRIACAEVERLKRDSDKQLESSNLKIRELEEKVANLSKEQDQLIKQRDSAIQEAHLWRSEIAKARERAVILEGAAVRAEERVRVTEAIAEARIKEAIEKEAAAAKEKQELLEYVNALQEQLKRQQVETHMYAAIIDQPKLLIQLEDILESDPHIDEVGFVHPTQFALFNKEIHSSPPSSSGASCPLEDEMSRSKQVQESRSDKYFWHSEHKLGISALVLLPLYKVAKDAFMDSYNRYRTLSDSQVKKVEIPDNNASTCFTSSLDLVESEVMKHSRALVLLSCDFGTAWNSRKLIVSKKLVFQMFMDELLLSALVLSHSPKSECAWSHRRWVIKMIAGKCANLQEIVERESELVKRIAENSKMNYRAWNHRCWLVPYMSGSQILLELRSSRDWAALHVADNSCFHYRARLLLQMIDNLQHTDCADGLSGAEFHRIWKEELDWVAMLIKRYVGREALWLHRRFLSLLWMKHLAIDDQSVSGTFDISMFVKDEIMLFHSCTIIHDNDFGDYQAQATYSATYIVWLAKQIPMSFGVELQKSSQYEALKLLVNEAGKSCLWDSMTATCGSTRALALIFTWFHPSAPMAIR